MNIQQPMICFGYYCFGEWNTCSEGGLPPFPSPNLMMSGYFSNFDGHHHWWLDLHRYGVVNIDSDNTCSDDGYSRKNTILHLLNTRGWFHSPCYWDVWVFSFLFWFLFWCLCTNHYCASLVVFFSPPMLIFYYQQRVSIAM
jgi:hypothetical protein